MASLRILVAEGNESAMRARTKARFGATPGERYAEEIRIDAQKSLWKNSVGKHLKQVIAKDRQRYKRRAGLFRQPSRSSSLKCSTTW